jgi:hypothetical protein
VNGPQQRAVVRYAQFVSGFFFLFGTISLLKSHFGGFTSSEGGQIFGMRMSPLTAVIQLVVGLVGIAMALSLEGARRFALLVGVVGVPFALLEFVVRDSSADIFGRDTRIALLQLAVALLGLAAWWWSRPAPAGSRTT